MSAELSFDPDDNLLHSMRRDRDAIAERLTAVEGELEQMEKLTARLARLRMRIDQEHRRLGALLGQVDAWLEFQSPAQPEPAADDPWDIEDDEEVVPLWVRPVQTQPIQFSKPPSVRVLRSSAPEGPATCDETIPIQLKPFDLPGRSPTFSRRPRCSRESE